VFSLIDTKLKYFVSMFSCMSEEELPQESSEDYVSNLINEIESQLPDTANYVTGIIVDEDRNVLILKNGKLYVGKDENNAKEIRKYAESNNPAYLVNALYVLREMVPGYKEFWSGELEKKAKKELNSIF